jgi:DNA-directed RNA polymerase subunit F
LVDHLNIEGHVIEVSENAISEEISHHSTYRAYSECEGMLNSSDVSSIHSSEYERALDELLNDVPYQSEGESVYSESEGNLVASDFSSIHSSEYERALDELLNDVSYQSDGESVCHHLAVLNVEQGPLREPAIESYSENSLVASDFSSLHSSEYERALEELSDMVSTPSNS